MTTFTDLDVLSKMGWRQRTLRVLFCWRCGVGQAPFIYRQSEELVEIVSHGEGEEDDDFPYLNYPQVVPYIEFALRPLPEPFDQLLREVHEDVDWPHSLTLFVQTPRHQVLGRPFVYDDREDCCPECAKPLLIVATIGNDIGDGYIQTDNSYVMLMVRVCTDCSIVRVDQQCD